MRHWCWRLVRRTLPLLLVPAVAGCSSWWNALNRTSLEADMGEVLTRALEDRPEIECQMIGATRSGYCTFELDSAGGLAAAQALGLEPRIVDLDDPSTVPPAETEGMVGCLASEVLGLADGFPAYWTGGRSASLSLESGGQFEYLLLVLNPETGQACVQVSYAYG